MAGLFPLIDGDEFNDLAADIAAHGLREPIVLYDGAILDGRNRYAACLSAGVAPRFVEYDGDDALAFVLSLNLHRRHLDESQRGMVAARVANMPAHRPLESTSIDVLTTQPDAARMLNVSLPTVQRARVVLDHGAPELVDAVERGDVAVSTASEIARVPHDEQRAILADDAAAILRRAREIKTERAHTRKAAREERALNALDADHPLAGAAFALHIADIRDGLPMVADASVDAIITDPPYPAEFLPLYGDLARVARRVLKPGAPCIVMCGQSHIASVMSHMSDDLAFNWMLAYLTPGQSTQVFGRRVKSNWKPLLWMTNGANGWAEHVSDTVTSNENDKAWHGWGQSVGGMAAIIDRFTSRGMVVLDPFCGAGTTGVAAVRLARPFIGADVSATEIAKTAERIAEAEYVAA